MDILKRSLAPVTEEAWDEILETSKEVFNKVLSARKFIDVDGPKGMDFPGISLGRLDIPGNQKDPVNYGIHQFQPMVETRAMFKLNIWELDNINRGAEDIDFDALEGAAMKIGEFEENAIYNGFSKGNIKGLKNSSEHKTLKYPDDPGGVMKVLSEGVATFTNSYIEGPYSLVVGKDRWQDIMSYHNGYPLKKQITNLIEGKIIYSPHLKESYLVSERGGDFRLTLGGDLSIGYDSHDTKNVQLFFTESFTFQVIDPAAVIVIK